MVSVPECFSESYAEARPKFCSAAAASGGEIRSWLNPSGRGPTGEALYLDTARFGPRDAPNMLVLIAGTHGVEGHCGSGAEIAWLRNGGPDKLPKDTGALLIHAINPHGFAWTRRVTEDNVDLNRNFVDHDKAYPKNEGYLALADAVLPREWNDASLRRDREGIRELRPEPRRLRPAGRAERRPVHPCRRHLLRRQQADLEQPHPARHRPRRARQARQVAVIDFHTGLGPFGHGELICAVPPTSKSFPRAKAWYGDEMTSPEGGTSTSAIVVGIMTDAFPQELPDALVTPIAIEYGTYAVPEVLSAVRADNWLHQRGDLGSAQGRALKADMKERFFPSGDKWREMVWARADQTIGWALKGMRGP